MSWSPDFARKRCRDEADPEYCPKKTSASKPAKGPPKKRGRPPKAKKQETSVEKLNCPVCKEPAKGRLVVTKCGHYFHDDCLKGWLATKGQSAREADKKVCPMCGMDFDPKFLNPIYLGL